MEVVGRLMATASVVGGGVASAVAGLPGGWGDDASSDGFEEVVDQGVEVQFGCSPVESAAGEAPESEVVFGVGEWGLRDVAALFVEGVAFRSS